MVSPKLKEIHQDLLEWGFKPHLSGSGSTLFLFNLSKTQKEALLKIQDIEIIDTQEHQ